MNWSRLSKKEKIVLFVLLIGVVLVIYLYYNKQENLVGSHEMYDIILEYLKKNGINNYNVIELDGKIQNPINANAQTLIIYTKDFVVVLGKNIHYDITGNIIHNNITGITIYDLKNMKGHQHNTSNNMKFSFANNSINLDIEATPNKIISYDLSQINKQKQYTVPDILNIMSTKFTPQVGNNISLIIGLNLNNVQVTKINFLLDDMLKFMITKQYIKMSKTCENKHMESDCKIKAESGECTNQPGRMFNICRNTCKMCNLDENSVNNLFKKDIEEGVKFLDLIYTHQDQEKPQQIPHIEQQVPLHMQPLNHHNNIFHHNNENENNYHHNNLYRHLNKDDKCGNQIIIL